MPSPNLSITHVAAAQNQKEVTINDAVDALDRAITDTALVAFAAGAATLSAADFRAAVAFQPAAALEAPSTLTVPEIRRLFLVVNTDPAHAITVARGTASVVVASGATAVLCTDGTADGLFAAGGSGQSAASVYDFGMMQWETPAPGAVTGKVVIPRALTIAADFAGSHGHVDTPPATTGWSLAVTLNGTTIGTVTIDGTGTFVFATTGGTSVAVAVGDVVRFVASAANDPAEASLAGLALTIAAELG